MLKLKNIVLNEEIVYIEFDNYIPFNIKVGESKSNNLYFRYGDGKRSLLEVGVDTNKGVLSSCTLILIKKDNINIFDGSFKSSVCVLIEGIPIFDIEESNSSDYLNNWFIDNFDSDIYLDIGNNYIALRFSHDKYRVESYVGQNRFMMGFDSCKELYEIVITEISLKEMEVIKVSLNLN